jgi:superfamily II DNA helicase RecQ
MQFKLFTIPASDDGVALDELNKFMRTNKVLEVEQQLVTMRNESHWHFCVKYLANAQPGGKPQTPSKVDYKEYLDEKSFAIFSILRECRKKIAEEDGLPVYAVFTNEELAGIAALEEINTVCRTAITTCPTITTTTWASASPASQNSLQILNRHPNLSPIEG